MKKKFSALLGLVLCSSMLFTACGEGGVDSTPSQGGSTGAQSVNLVDSAVTMDCFESYTLDVETKGVTGNVVWTSSDPSVLSVDQNGVVTSNIKEGKATVTASVGDYSDACDVVVMAKGGTPSVSVKNDITVSEGSVYAMDVSAEYNGMDITEYVTFGVNAYDDAQTVATATAEGSVITFTGADEGTAGFSVYTTIFGQLYAEEVNVTVKNTDLTFVVNGDSDEGLLLQPKKTVSTSDVAVYYQGKPVDSSTLSWSIADESIATIGEGGVLQLRQEGKTYLITEYQGYSISVNVSVVKDRATVEVQQETLPYINCDTEVVATLITYPTTGERTMTVNETNVDTLTLPDVVEGGKIYGVSMDGKELDISCFSYDEGVVSIQTKVFGLDIYGEHSFSLQIEGVDTIYTYVLKATVVTKKLMTLNDYKACVVMGWQGDQLFGYYTLGIDIDFGGRGYAEYATDWNYMNGFRGTLDGAGHKIINYMPGNYGLTAQIGEGAVMKNLVFEDLIYMGDGTGIFARGARNATFENITVASFSEESTFAEKADTTADRGGLFVGHQMVGCTWRNITVNAQGKAIYSLFGGKNNDPLTSVFENVVVNASSVRYYACCSKTRPDGVTLNKS